MYLLQHWFSLSNEGVEDAIYDSYALRKFMGINFFEQDVPDATTLLHFRHLLMDKGIGKLFFDTINRCLEHAGRMMRGGTIVDATLISAPSSTKNVEKKRDPEMHSVKKGKQRHWGIKCHTGEDAGSGFVHKVEATAANVHDITVAAGLLREDDEVVYGDSTCLGIEKRVEKYIHGLFPIWGIRFIAVADNVDTAAKGNKKARRINGLVNERYLEDLSENIRMVFDLKRRKGQYIGGFPIYGYRKDTTNKNHIIPDTEAVEAVRQIYHWSLEDCGWQSIAHLLNQRGIPNPTRYKANRGWTCNHPIRNDFGLWSKVTVGRILTNEMYTGVMVQGRQKKVSYKSKTVIDTPESE